MKKLGVPRHDQLAPTDHDATGIFAKVDTLEVACKVVNDDARVRPTARQEAPIAMRIARIEGHKSLPVACDNALADQELRPSGELGGHVPRTQDHDLEVEEVVVCDAIKSRHRSILRELIVP